MLLFDVLSLEVVHKFQILELLTHFFVQIPYVPNEQLLCLSFSQTFQLFSTVLGIVGYVVNLKLVSRVRRRRETLGIGDEIVSAIRQ